MTRTLKYAGAVVCGLLAAGSLPSAYLIASGLLKGVSLGEMNHFAWKLTAYVGWIVLLFYGSYQLWKAATIEKK